MNSNKHEETEMKIDSKKDKIISFENFPNQIDGIIYNIELVEKENIIIIKYNKYESILNLEDFNSLFKSEYKLINDCYKYLFDNFVSHIYIKQILNEQYFVLAFNHLPEIELKLIYDKNASKSSLTDIVELTNKLSSKIETFENEISNLKKQIKNKSKEDFNDPRNIEFLNDVVKNSFAQFSYEDSFIVFLSIENILELVYATKEKSIISYDLNQKKNIFSYMKAHQSSITNFKYFFDEVNNRDIIMSISKKDNNIKIWNANKWEIISDIKGIYRSNFLFSACFFKKENESYIISSNGKTLQPYQEFQNFEPLKIYNFQGELVEEINDWDDCTYFIDVYYDNILEKNFILTGNYNYVKAYDYDNNKLYHKYHGNNNGIHPSVIINKFGEKIKLIESCEDGYIRIWNFHSCELIRKINTENNNLYGICLWSKNYIFVGCKDQSIKLIELKNGLLIKSLKGHKGRIISFKKIEQNNNEYLFSQGLDGTIKQWINFKTK